MKVISIQQPFASLIAENLKEYEFRTWKTAYRGDILIHSSKSLTGKYKASMNKFTEYDLEYPLGCLIAKATLTDCIQVDEVFKQSLRAKNPLVYSGITEDDTWSGYAFKLENIEKIEPIYTGGKLGLWEYDYGGGSK